MNFESAWKELHRSGCVAAICNSIGTEEIDPVDAYEEFSDIPFKIIAPFVHKGRIMSIEAKGDGFSVQLTLFPRSGDLDNDGPGEPSFSVSYAGFVEEPDEARDKLLACLP